MGADDAGSTVTNPREPGRSAVLPSRGETDGVTGKRQSGAVRRTRDLARTKMQLTQEIDERTRAQGSLQGAYAELRRLTDRLQAENVYLQQEIDREHNFGEIVGQSPPMLQLRLRVEQVAALPVAVLLRGEAGTGKGVVARAIHEKSSRRDRPLIRVNLAALPANLIESELFGWERGERTGAETRQVGRLELADAGTIFLEEIGELPLMLQGKLLHLILEQELEQLGSHRPIKVDVRVIAASSRNLEAEVRAGRFREDLYCLLAIYCCTVPPLRERPADIPLLVDHFIVKHNKQVGTGAAYVADADLNGFLGYSWPGNVRELEGIIERGVIGPGGELLLPLLRAGRVVEG